MVESKNTTKPQKAVSTETTTPKPMETQTSQIPLPKSRWSTQITFTFLDIVDFLAKQLDTEAQTDPWVHDPNCSCGCCPKTELEVNEVNVATDEQTLQDTATSHAVLTESKSVSVERQSENIEVQTSINKACKHIYTSITVMM